jgi:hypothetical protein
MPPLQMSRSVAKPVNQAKRFSQIVDFGSDPTFIFRNELE